MLKTIAKTEFHKILRILRKYHVYLKDHRDSIQLRYYGLHQIVYKMKGKLRKQYLLIMNNVFGLYSVDWRYDLKGSSVAWWTIFKDGIEDLKISLKDMDFIDR